MYDMPNLCPICSGELTAAKLRCGACGTSMEGEFAIDRLVKLSAQQRQFVVAFLRNRGNIREMEKELGISYPTVRTRLDEILGALGERCEDGPAPDRKDILEMLARGEITAEDAQRMLKG